MRLKLIDKLVDEARQAENIYLNSDYEDSSAKDKHYQNFKKAKLTEKEVEKYQQDCNALGV